MKKRMAAAVLILLLLSSVALAATVKLQIDSSQKLSKQFESFRAYLDRLPAADRAAWDEELATLVDENRSNAQAASDHQSPQVEAGVPPSEKLVWIPKSGKKYHRTSTCSSMKNPRQVDISEAISAGYEPCGRCKP